MEERAAVTHRTWVVKVIWLAFALTLSCPLAAFLVWRTRLSPGNPASTGEALGVMIFFLAPAALANLVGAGCGMLALCAAERPLQRGLALLAMALNLLPWMALLVAVARLR